MSAKTKIVISEHRVNPNRIKKKKICVGDDIVCNNAVITRDRGL